MKKAQTKMKILMLIQLIQIQTVMKILLKKVLDQTVAVNLVLKAVAVAVVVVILIMIVIVMMMLIMIKIRMKKIIPTIAMQLDKAILFLNNLKK